MKKKTRFPLFLAPAVILLAVGCTTHVPPSSNSSTSSEEEPPIEYGDPVLENSKEYNEFWNPNSSLSITVSMSQAAADFINSYQCNHNDSTYFDYYVPCTFILTMNGTTYAFEEVGIREKGNMSRTNILNGEGNFSLDTLAHYKFNFKETFDGSEYTDIAMLQQFKKTWDDDAARKQRKNRTLFDMEKIDIKWNRNVDETKSKQAFANKLFRDAGVMAGHDTLANTTIGIDGKTPINTTYEVLECIDSVFIKRHFDELRADGDLYKCCYTDRGPANLSKDITIGNQIGVEDNTTGFHPAYDLKTNKKKNTTHTSFFNFLDVVNDKTSSASEFKNKVEKVLDVEAFMKYEAVAFLLGNFDDMRNNANNYYLYIASSSNIAYIIPYDFDRCLGSGAEGRSENMTNHSAESTKMQCSGNWQSINLYWRTVCTTTNSDSGHANVERVEDYRMMYQKNIENLLNNKTLSVESFTSYVNSFPESYRGNPNGAGDGNIAFAEYFNAKVSKIKTDVYTSGYDIKI